MYKFIFFYLKTICLKNQINIFKYGFKQRCVLSIVSLANHQFMLVN